MKLTIKDYQAIKFLQETEKLATGRTTITANKYLKRKKQIYQKYTNDNTHPKTI